MRQVNRPAPTPMTWATLAVAVAGFSTSGPLMAAIVAPALAIAFWRNAMSMVVLVPVTAVRLTREPGDRPDRRTLAGGLLAGAFLAAHFGTWVPSVTMTSVATATALVSTQPVWAALLAVRGGERFSRQFWIGVLFALAGVALMTGADISVSGKALVGDGLALFAAMMAACYVTVGSRVRAAISTTTYTTICYGVVAVVLLGVCLVGGVRLSGYSTHAWLLLLAVTIGPQFLGHSLLNRVLSSLSATTVSVLSLLQVPVAALLAWMFLGQVPELLAVPGMVVLLVGLGLVVLGSRPEMDLEV
jgi:drug/metabolite transporter (DMT)-like permease